MNPREYEILYQAEQTHWWYRALRKRVTWLWNQYLCTALPPASVHMLDIGCGTGGMLQHFQTLANGDNKPARVHLFAMDYAYEALRLHKKTSTHERVRASAVALPFAAERFHLAVSFDVLCHRAVQDKQQFLNEAYRVLVPNGFLLLNLPAYQSLLSSHDVAVHNDTRFTIHTVKPLLEKAGFNLVHYTYWNTFLLPPIALLRLVRRNARSTQSDLPATPSTWSNTLCTALLDSEAALLPHCKLPCGVSFMLLARKTA